MGISKIWNLGNYGAKHIGLRMFHKLSMAGVPIGYVLAKIECGVDKIDPINWFSAPLLLLSASIITNILIFGYEKIKSPPPAPRRGTAPVDSQQKTTVWTRVKSALKKGESEKSLKDKGKVLMEQGELTQALDVGKKLRTKFDNKAIINAVNNRKQLGRDLFEKCYKTEADGEIGEAIKLWKKLKPIVSVNKRHLIAAEIERLEKKQPKVKEIELNKEDIEFMDQDKEDEITELLEELTRKDEDKRKNIGEEKTPPAGFAKPEKKPGQPPPQGSAAKPKVDTENTMVSALDAAQAKGLSRPDILRLLRSRDPKDRTFAKQALAEIDAQIKGGKK